MIVWLLAIGAVSLLGQVVLLRELNVAFFGSELVYILAIGIWLLWTAVGAAVGRRSYLPPAYHVRSLLIGLGLALPACAIAVRGIRQICGAVPGTYLPFPTQILAMALALLPVGVTLGLLFQWTAKIYVTRRHTLAAAYAIESGGGLVGGLLATLLLVVQVSNLATALICGLCAVIAAGWPGVARRPWQPPASIAVGAVLVTALLASPWLDRRSTAWDHPQLLATRDSPYGRITLCESVGQLTVFENGALAYESEGTDAEEFAHLAALQVVTPDSVLILGGGVSGLVQEVLQHRPRVVDYIELNGILLDLMQRHLPAAMRSSLVTAEVRITQTDPRRYLQSAPDYDLILVGMPEPASGQVNRFYTQEFFTLCAERLTAGGVLAFRMRAAENLWTPQQLRRAASIHRALQGVFADVVVLPGTSLTILASAQRLTRQPTLLAERMQERQITARLVSPPYLNYLYTNDRFFQAADLLTSARAPANSDVRPVCYQFTLLLWLAKFFPVLSWLEIPQLSLGSVVRSPWSWLAVVVLTGTLLAGRRHLLVRRGILAAVAGFCGMVLQTVVILNYQTGSGVLYQDLGLLLTLFMAGLALGAAGLDRLARKGLAPATGAVLLGLFVALAVGVASLVNGGLAQGLVATALLQVACGFLVAALFAFASLHRQPDQRLVVSPLYAADLLGGCCGSLIASLFLVPVLGLGAAALAVAGLLVLSLVLI
jgi:spermidine synthase